MWWQLIAPATIRLARPQFCDTLRSAHESGNSRVRRGGTTAPVAREDRAGAHWRPHPARARPPALAPRGLEFPGDRDVHLPGLATAAVRQPPPARLPAELLRGPPIHPAERVRAPPHPRPRGYAGHSG